MLRKASCLTLITIAFLNYTADPYFLQYRPLLHDHDSAQLESFCYFRNCTLINLNSYGQILLLLFLLSLFYFIITFCKCCL